MLANLEHRGASGAEKNTGDGAGILLQMPHAFLSRECAGLGVALGEPGQYAVGMVFLPPHDAGRAAIEQLLEETVRAEGQVLLGPRSMFGRSRGRTAARPARLWRATLVGNGWHGCVAASGH